MKIGIIRLSSLGDILHTLPLVARLKKDLPQAHITWIVEKDFSPLLTLCKEIDEIITVPLKEWRNNWWQKKTWKHVVAFKKKLSCLDLDITIDPQGLFKSGIIASFIKAPKRIGFSIDNSREFNFLFNNIKVRSKNEINIIYKNNLLLTPLSIQHPQEITLPSFNLPKADEGKIKQFFFSLNLKKKVLVNPWSAVKLKELPFEPLKHLCEQLYQKNASPPILMFGPKEKAIAKKYAKLIPVHLGLKTSLTEAASLINNCDEYIGVDSGPTYIAALLNKPTTILFGPTNDKRQSPYFDNVKTVYSSYDCPTVKSSPIVSPYRCAIKKCPNNLCMKNFKFQT